jgi:hypothetical protein
MQSLGSCVTALALKLFLIYLKVWLSFCVCMCARVCVCMCVCARAYVCVCVHVECAFTTSKVLSCIE